MKKVNETYFPRGGTKKGLVAKKLPLFKKISHKPKKQVLKKKVKEKSVKPELSVQFQTQKIQNLSSHTLMEGMLVFGCVKEIRSFYVSLFLAGRTSARLPITAISPIYTNALQELSKGTITEEECPPLSTLFQIGETLCCHVNSITDLRNGYLVVTVSVNPADVNKARSHSNVKVGDLLIAAVESREDYGYQMFTGINGLTAFLKDSEALKYIQERNGNKSLASGQVIRCIVTKAVGGGSSTVVELTASPDVVWRSVLTSDISLQKLIPTTKVEVIINNIRPDGLEVKVVGCSENLQCYIEQIHLESCWSTPKDYTPGTRFKAIVLYIIQSAKMVFLSLKEELNGVIEQKLKIGAVINNAKVATVTTQCIYIMIGRKEAELKGVISLKHIDGNLEAGELPIKYPVGMQLQTRVLDFNPVEQTYICSLKRSFIKESYVAVSDVKVGDIVNCTVKTLVKHGALILLGQLTAYVPAVHVSDVPVTKIESVLSVGKEVKARVLSVTENGRIIATLKPTLLESTPLMSYEQAQEGDQYCGVITSFSHLEGLNVAFYNNVRGHLPCPYKGYKKDFVVGQSVKCFIVHVELSKMQITLGLSVLVNQQDQNTLSGTVAKPATSEPAAAKPSVTNPVVAKPVAAIPAAAEPAVANQVAAKPVRGSWNEKLKKCEMSRHETAETVDALIKEEVFTFITYLAECYRKQDYKPGTRLTGRVTSTKDGIHVVLKHDAKGVVLHHPSVDCTKYRTGQEITANVLWQDPTTKLVYLLPLHVLRENQNVDSRSRDFIGTLVKGCVLFSEPEMTICVLVDRIPLRHHLAYIPCFDSVLPVWTKHDCIIYNVVGNFIICLLNQHVIDVYSNFIMELPQLIVKAQWLSDIWKNDKETKQFLAEKKKQDREYTCGESESSKQNRRKIKETSFSEEGDEFSVVSEKMKNSSPPSGKKGNGTVNTESKQKKKKKKEIVKDNDADVNACNTENLKKEIQKKTKKSNEEQKSDETDDGKTDKSNKRKRKIGVNVETPLNEKMVKRNQRNSKYVADGEDKNNENAKQIQDSPGGSVEAAEEETQRNGLKRGTQNLTLSETGFFWDAKPEDLMGTIDERVEADDSEEDEEESNQKLKSRPKSRMTAAEKRAAVKEAELKLRQKEAELLEAEVNPQSADQFDRALLSNPENAELWIKYMAYHLQATEIEKARSVARRALQTMSYRSEGERLNVWVALLNLENMYGTQESLKETLDEALKTNDDYLVYSKMLEIYANSNKSHDAEQLVNTMLRKFRESQECWLHCCVNLMNCGLHDKARNLLQRALSSLQTKEHVNLISKFALLENKHGFKEKAVTLLENVLITYPGRVDIWNVYVDMLVKLGDITQARQVLERAANQKLTARKMKTIYSKWLSFEEKFGDENSVQHVKKAALHYVNTITSKLE